MYLTGFKFLSLFRISAIVLYPFIIFADKKPSPYIINHEKIHWFQIKRVGVFKFYFTYLLEYFRNRRLGLSHDQAYRQISFEREAYDHQYNLAYLSSEFKSEDDKLES